MSSHCPIKRAVDYKGATIVPVLQLRRHRDRCRRANGDDPAAKRDTDRQPLTVVELADRFDEEHIALRCWVETDRPSPDIYSLGNTLASFNRPFMPSRGVCASPSYG